ncbi:MAG TPA: AraC family transcriptional regulator [Candidatus Kurthia intestinigallinarum]|nr:AraC family transcriptional regulator [Candidatus Kurthia intestinigallinarum]
MIDEGKVNHSIAKLLHFHDQSHFTKVLKKFTNCTPKQFRSIYS